MYTRLGEETLKTGERLEVGVVLGPDAVWRPKDAPFLWHKNRDSRAHIERSLDGPLDDLQSRYYVGSVSGRLISQIMIVGDRGVGILGHVYTLPAERRKGACAAIMRHQMEDCRRAGFRVLCLGTGYDSPPYWIYHSFGFRSIAPESGAMKWLAEPDAEARVFAPAKAHVRDLRWDDWGYFDCLGMLPVAPGEELPRCPTLGLKAQAGLEGPFVGYRLKHEQAGAIQAKVLVSETGATVGWALLGPDTRLFGHAPLLDLFTHPNFTDRLPDLLAALDLPPSVSAYLTEPEGPRAAVLEQAGLRRAARLPAWITHDGQPRDLVAWRREA